MNLGYAGMPGSDLKKEFKKGYDRARRLARKAAHAPKPKAKRPRYQEARASLEGAEQSFVFGLIRGTRIIDFSARLTTLRAPWYKKRCVECGHTFREGDPVVACPEPTCNAVYHQHPLHNLECFGVTFDHDKRCRCEREFVSAPPVLAGVARDLTPSMRAFIQGIKKVLKEDPNVSTIVADERHEGQLCAVCGHTIRLKEVVVKCPCPCGCLIHFDVARQMRCWLEWKGGRGRDRCPLTGLELAQ